MINGSVYRNRAFFLWLQETSGVCPADYELAAMIKSCSNLDSLKRWSDEIEEKLGVLEDLDYDFAIEYEDDINGLYDEYLHDVRAGWAPGEVLRRAALLKEREDLLKRLEEIESLLQN